MSGRDSSGQCNPVGSGWAAHEGTLRARSATQRTRGDTVLWRSLRRRHGLGVALYSLHYEVLFGQINFYLAEPNNEKMFVFTV